MTSSFMTDHRQIRAAQKRVAALEATVTKIYTIIANGEKQIFKTNLTEREFYNSLDAVYGKDNYWTECIDYEFERD